MDKNNFFFFFSSHQPHEHADFVGKEGRWKLGGSQPAEIMASCFDFLLFHLIVKTGADSTDGKPNQAFGFRHRIQ
jgi:hypothetical protein